jgi:hypothetical protein
MFKPDGSRASAGGVGLENVHHLKLKRGEKID